jgi:glutaconyl-CoA decarboxylase
MSKKYNITVNGNVYAVEVEEVGGAPTVVAAAPAPVAAPAPAPAPAAAPAPAPAAAPAPATPAAAPSAGAETIEAPMPGTILDVRVSAGQNVSTGDVLLILEAMKMENEILAPRDGVVDAVIVAKGAQVNAGDAMVSLK